MINFRAGVEAVVTAWEREPEAEVEALLYMHEGNVRAAIRQWLRQRQTLIGTTLDEERT